MPALYGKGIDKVKLCINQTSSQKSKSTIANLEKEEIRNRNECILFYSMHTISEMTFLQWTFTRFRFITLRKTTSKNNEWTLENATRGTR